MMTNDESLSPAIRHASASHQEPPRDRLGPFLAAVKIKFGFSSFSWDLNAEEERFCRRADRCFTLADNPLAQDWSSLGHGHLGGGQANLWLWPPRYMHGKIDQWVQKCAESTRVGARRVRIFLLTSANMSSTWFNNSVVGNAIVFVLRERLCSLGQDLPMTTQMLSVFDGTSSGIELWDWSNRHKVRQGGLSEQVVTVVAPASKIVAVQ